MEMALTRKGKGQLLQAVRQVHRRDRHQVVLPDHQADLLQADLLLVDLLQAVLHRVGPKVAAKKVRQTMKKRKG